MANLAHLLIERAGARVLLSGSQELVQRISEHCRSYYLISSPKVVPANTWTIFGIEAGDEKPTTNCFRSAIRSEPERIVFYDLNRRTLTIATEATQWLPIFCSRLIRDVLRWQLLETGELFFQADLVKVRDRGVALVGPPRSGKTTTALALVGFQRGTLVADNDLSLKWKPPVAPSGMGWPRSICIRTNTLNILQQCLPQLSQRMESFAHPNNRIDPSTLHEFLYVLPKELATLTNLPIVPTMTVSCFIFPEFSGRDKVESQLIQLTEHEARRRLLASWDFLAERKIGHGSGTALQGSQNWPSMCFNPFLVESFRLPNPEQLISDVYRLAQQLPSYVLRQSPGALFTSTESICRVV